HTRSGGYGPYGGGGSAPRTCCRFVTDGCYRTFRWWGIGTRDLLAICGDRMLSNFPMVGNRNQAPAGDWSGTDVIELSDGGESELARAWSRLCRRCYRTFRWWGIGTGGWMASIRSEVLWHCSMEGNRN